MASYTRQSSFADGDTITAALFNNEFNQLVNAFHNSTGHKHDGTTAEGPVIGLIGDAGETSPNNKVLIDTVNNYIEFYVEVSSAPVQQLYIADGAIIPVTDSDVDLGTTSLRFKDTYTDTVTTTGNVDIGGNLTVTGNATISGNLTFGDADTDSINLAAEIDSDIIPNTDGTYDLGSATKEWQDLYIDGTANIDSLIADTADINGGTIDGATIATSDITVGSGKTLDVSAGTLTLADDQISGDKVEGGTIAATTITTLTSTTGNVTNVNATTVDTTNIEVTNIKAKDGTAAGSIADSTGVVTLASSVLTTTDINGGTIDGTTIATSDITVGAAKTLDVSAGTLTLADNQISGDKVEGGTIAATTITDLTFGSLNDGTITVTAFVDEDTMVSNSATLVPTQQSVKAYVDSQVTAQDLDFQGDTGGALSIDLDSETLTVAGGTGIDTSGALNTLTVAIDSTVATLTGTQTLTNKTLTTPVISSISNTGTLTLPTSTDTLVGRATTDTLTNKTLTSPVINTGVSGTAVLDDDTFATASATTLATSESIKAYVDAQILTEDTLAELNDTNITTPADGSLLFYDTGTSMWIDNVVSGDITIADTGVAAISSGVIVNDDINASAAISISKTALVGGTGLTLTGDTLSVDASQTQITAVGTLTTGTWNATSIADAYVDNNLTIDGGTVDNSVIGGSTPAAGTFTTLTANTSITGTLATAAQTNITSVGTLGSLTVSGDLTIDTSTLVVDSTNNRVGILDATPAVSLDAGSATDAIFVPKGTTAQRPTGVDGYFRYNTDDAQFEGYADGAWGAIAGSGGSGGIAPSVNTMTGDGSDTTLSLSTTPVNENATIVTFDGVVQHKDTYSLAGSTITFSTAPPTGVAVECIVINTNTISTATIVQDADLDTKIQVEESADEDIIRFDTAGTERMTVGANGDVNVNASARIAQGALTSSTNSVAWDSRAIANAYHVTTENTTFAAPTNSVEGAIISVEIAQGGTPYTVAWNTVFEFAASTAPTVTATANKTDIFSFRYNGSVWQEIGRTQNMAQT